MHELDALLDRIREANSCLANMDLWEHGGRGSADDATIARMEAEANAAMADLPVATAALEALVGKLGVEAPAVIEQWVAAPQAASALSGER